MKRFHYETSIDAYNVCTLILCWPFSLYKKVSLSLFYADACFAGVNVCTSRDLNAWGVRRRYRIPWTWSYRRLWYTLNGWAISQFFLAHSLQSIVGQSRHADGKVKTDALHNICSQEQRETHTYLLPCAQLYCSALTQFGTHSTAHSGLGLPISIM